MWVGVGPWVSRCRKLTEQVGSVWLEKSHWQQQASGQRWPSFTMSEARTVSLQSPQDASSRCTVAAERKRVGTRSLCP